MTIADVAVDRQIRWPLMRMLALGRPVRTNLVVAVLAGAATVGAAIALLACSGFLLARASQHPNIVALSIAVVAVRALGVTRGLSRYVERLAGHDAALRVLADLRGSVFARLERLSPTVLGRLRGGDLVTRFVADIDAVQDLFIRGIAPPLVAALVGGLTVAFVVAISVPGGLVLAAGLAIAGIGLPAIAALMTRRTAEKQSMLRAELSVVMVDLVDGAAEVAALGASDQLLDRLDQVDTQLTRLSRRSAAANAVGIGGANLVAGLTLFGVLLSGVAAAHRGSLGAVPLAVIVLTAIAAFEVTATLPAAAVALQSVRASARRVLEVLDAPAAITEPEHVVALPAGQLELTLRAVTLTYPGASTPSLRDIDVTLTPGHRIGVVGASGSGKSTLAAVLLRLVDIDSGAYRLGGVDASDLDPDDVRRVVSGCPADPHIFDSTIRANLLLARPAATDGELAATITAVRLDGWIAGLPDGLDTAVGSHGVAMSGGQRQRLAIARALLVDPQVLVLDEPTVHLDAETADAVMSDLLAATAGRTTVLITHDRRGLDSMDEVLTLAGGVVVPELQAATPA